MARPWRLEWSSRWSRARQPVHRGALATPRPLPAPLTLEPARVATVERRAPLIHLLHIMKTGGTSLTNALFDAAEQAEMGLPRSGVFLDELIRLDPAGWPSIALVAGHLPYEARELLPSDTVSVTVLRDPIERTLSHFAEVSRNPAVRMEHPDLTVEQFVELPRWRTLVEDYQVRQLAHRIGLAGAGTEWDPAERYEELGPPFPPEHELPLQCYFDCSPLPDDRSRLLDDALTNLASVEVVGTVEELDVVHRQVVRYWPGANRWTVGRDQVSDNRLGRHDLPIRLLRRIDAATQADRELYDEARRRSTVARRTERLARVA